MESVYYKSVDGRPWISVVVVTIQSFTLALTDLAEESLFPSGDRGKGARKTELSTKTTYRQTLENPCSTTGVLWLVVSEEYGSHSCSLNNTFR
jgi:hypothetical protein